MSRIIAWLWVSLLVIGCAIPLFAQQSAASASARSSSVVVPSLVNFSGVLSDGNGKPLTSVVGVTFAFYKDGQGGTPLWLETQNVYPDKTGHYTVLLGSTSGSGIPSQVFATGEARWLGVQPQGQPEQARVPLLSVPYAMKAEDAQTVGGLPASAFVLAAQPSSTSAKAAGSSTTAHPLATGTTPVTTAGGTVNQLAKFDASADITNSQIFDNGTNVGVGTTTPAAKLGVNGSVSATSFNIGGNSFAFGSYSRQNAFLGFAGNTVTTGKWNTASGYWALHSNTTGDYNTASGEGALGSNTTGSYNTASGRGALGGNTQGSNNTAIGETALGTNNSGVHNTATGYQALVDNTTGYSNTTNGSLSLFNNATGYYNTASGVSALFYNVTGNSNTAIGFNAGPDQNSSSLTNATAIGANAVVSESNALVLGGTGSNAVSVGIGTATPAYTLDVHGTGNFTGPVTFASGQAFPGTATLGANTFTGNQTVNGNLSATGLVTGTGFNIGSNLFGWGSFANQNAFTGFAGSTAVVAQGNTGVGYGALGGLFGDSANDGWNNTAVGTYALNVNDNESGVGNLATGNTAVGSSALAMNTTGSDNTAAGFLALNSNLTGTNNTAVGTIAGEANDQTTITGSGNTFLGFFAKMSTGTLNNATAIGAYALVAESNALVLGSIKGLNGATSNTNVGIGTATPDNMLTVNGSADKPGGGSWGTYSDRRLKTLDGNFNSGLSQIMKLRPVRYRYNKDNALGIQDEQEHVGLVAQDVQKVIPEAVTENNKGYLLLDNDPILWSMLNAIKEQQGLIRKQQSQMKAQQAEIARLRSQVKAIQDSLYTKGRTGSEVRTVKVQVPAIQQ